MSILTRYLLRAHIGPFVFALSVLTGLLLINTVARRFEELAGKGLPIAVIGEVLLLSLPHILALTVPMAVLVAVLYALSQLVAENEITALKASGVNPLRLVVPLLVCGTIFFWGMVYFNDRILPETNHALKNLLIDISRKSPTLELREQVVNEIRTGDRRSRYYLQAGRIDPATNRLQDVVIYDLSAPARDRTIYADRGRMAFCPDQVDLFLFLQDGKINEVNKRRPDQFQRIFFEEFRIRMEGVGNQLERSSESLFRSDREMTLAMLSASVRERERELGEVRDELKTEVVEAVRYALDGKHKVAQREDAAGAEPRRGLRTATPRPGRDEASIDAMTRRTGTHVEALASRAKSLQRRIDAYNVEYHKKYAIAFACLMFVLIGPPLALRFSRGGVGPVIAISLGIFAVYYVMLIGGENLGKDGHMSPFWAMWLANVIGLALGLWGLARISRIRGTNRGDGGYLLQAIRSRLWPGRSASETVAR